jgi:hypothetical protein
MRGPGLAAAAGLLLAILALPSAIPALLVSGWLRLGAGPLLDRVLASPGAWASLALAVGVHAAEVASELHWQPERTLAATGRERAAFFIQRSLAVGLLAAAAGRTIPARETLAAYVLVVAGLFTVMQIHPPQLFRPVAAHKK